MEKNFKDFHYFAVRCAGKCTSLSAYQFERCLKRGGINTFDDLLNASQEDLSQIKGIGPKRLQQCIEIKNMISWHRKNNSL